MSNGSGADIARRVLNTLTERPVFRIHPAIGIARVGNAPASQFFIGPEIPGQGPTGIDGGAGSPVPPLPGASFKAGGLIKRQAARFRIYEYALDEKTGKRIPKEITLNTPGVNVQRIEWTVHLANRKASFFEFNGASGETRPQEKRRNAAKPKNVLELEPGPRTISGASASGVIFDQICADKEFLKSHVVTWVTPNVTPVPIDNLGELRTDDKGRLLVIGGAGTSGTNGSGKDRSIGHYANNDTWYDDISDGPVTAKVVLLDSKGVEQTFEADAAWVLVGPPDFAPQIGNVITLYDTLYDVTARLLTLPKDNPIYDEYEFDTAEGVRKKTEGLKRLKELKAKGAGAYEPSFDEEIRPILERAFAAKFVHEPAQSAHGTIGPDEWADLGDPAGSGLSEFIFSRLRPPAGNTDYFNANMPKLFGDSFDLDPGNAKFNVALTQTQFEFLRRWKDRKFIKGGAGPAPPPPPPVPRATSEEYVIVKGDFLSKIAARHGMTWQELHRFKGDSDTPNSARLRSGDPNLIFPGEIILIPKKAGGGGGGGGGGVIPPVVALDVTPHGLDRAALESCVGGAFYPGIEASWLMRNKKVFSEPFRIERFERDASGTVKVFASGPHVGEPMPNEVDYGNQKVPVMAGSFSQQMALPWQADFFACSKEELEVVLDPADEEKAIKRFDPKKDPASTVRQTITFGWWPGQRPDDVFKPGQSKSIAWDRGVSSMRDMVDKWKTRGFVVKAGDEFVENGGP